MLSDIFREAIIEGYLENNPVTPTRTLTPSVSRERLDLDQYISIREAAAIMSAWVGLSMGLALLTGQRREDIAAMQFDHIIGEPLQITPGKNAMMISLPLDLELKSVNMKLSTIVDRCRLASTTDFFLISAGVCKNSTNGALHLDNLTKKFVAARKKSGLDFQSTPPGFHEIRSLAGRLYEKEKGKEFAQKLLGHKSEKMTDKYLDTRGKEYVML